MNKTFKYNPMDGQGEQVVDRRKPKSWNVNEAFACIMWLALSLGFFAGIILFVKLVWGIL